MRLFHVELTLRVISLNPPTPTPDLLSLLVGLSKEAPTPKAHIQNPKPPNPQQPVLLPRGSYVVTFWVCYVLLERDENVLYKKGATLEGLTLSLLGGSWGLSKKVHKGDDWGYYVGFRALQEKMKTTIGFRVLGFRGLSR